MDKAAFKSPVGLILTTKIPEGVDENINISKRKQCQGCGKIFNVAKKN